MQTFIGDWMELHRTPDVVMCNVFPMFLIEPAQSWFDSLLPGLITSFVDFRKKFITQFAPQRTRKKTAKHLTTIVQCQEKPIREY